MRVIVDLKWIYNVSKELNFYIHFYFYIKKKHFCSAREFLCIFNPKLVIQSIAVVFFLGLKKYIKNKMSRDDEYGIIQIEYL